MRTGSLRLTFGVEVTRIAPEISKRIARGWLPLALIAAVACKNEPSPAALVEEQKRLAQEEPTGAAASAAQKEFVLTREKLDRYLVYQKQMVQLYSRLIKQAGQPKSAGRAAQLRRSELTVERQAALEKLVVEEERARAQSGLSLEDLRRVEQIIREVIGKRIYGAAVPEEDSVQRMEEMKAKLPPERQEESEKSIAEIRKSQEAVKRLAEERTKYGSANVDVVLGREPELTQAWKETMALFAAQTPSTSGALDSK